LRVRRGLTCATSRLRTRACGGWRYRRRSG